MSVCCPSKHYLKRSVWVVILYMVFKQFSLHLVLNQFSPLCGLYPQNVAATMRFTDPLYYHQIHPRPNDSKWLFAHLSQDTCHFCQTFVSPICFALTDPQKVHLWYDVGTIQSHTGPCFTDRYLFSSMLTGMLGQSQMEGEGRLAKSSPVQSKPLS